MTERCIISAVAHEGLTVTLPNGQRGHLAIVDATGNVITAGGDIETAAWEAAIHAYRNFLMGQGHLRVIKKPGATAEGQAA